MKATLVHLGRAYATGFVVGVAANAVASVIGWDLREFVYNIGFYLNVYIALPLTVFALSKKVSTTKFTGGASVVERAHKA